MGFRYHKATTVSVASGKTRTSVTKEDDSVSSATHAEEISILLVI